jgi:hypothetical protein
MAQLAADRPTWLRYFIRRDQRTPLGDVGVRSFLLRIGYQLAALQPDIFTSERIQLSVEQRVGEIEARGEVVGTEVRRILASPFYQKALEIRQNVERSRPPDAALQIFCQKQEPYLGRPITITPEDGRVRKDVETYARRLASRPDVAPKLGQLGMSVDVFVSRGVNKADGNIGYLNAIERAVDASLARIDNGDITAMRTLLEMREAPDDLIKLHAFFLQQIKVAVARQRVEFTDPETEETYDKPAWPTLYAPILGILSVAMEPLAAEELHRLGAKQSRFGDFVDALNGLRQFLDERGARYTFYHATVAEFLTAERTRENPETAGLYVDVDLMHKRIADYYWQTFHDDWPRCDNYGLANLALHLFKGKQFDRLAKLISEAWMKARYAGSRYTYNGFHDDVSLAWQTEFAKEAYDVITLVRLRTARQAVTQQARLFTNTDLKTLVWLGRKQEALAHARLRTEAQGTFEGLLNIYWALREREQSDIDLLNEAEEVVSGIPYEEPRADALRALAAAQAQAGHFAQAEETARANAGDEPRAEALRALAAALAFVGRFYRALITLDSIRLNEFLQALASLTPAFERRKPGLSVAVLREATGVAGWFSSDLSFS